MSESQKKKLKAEGTAFGAQRKREAEQDRYTLGDVAEDEDFAPLRQLLESVKNRPVNELGENTKEALRKKALETDAAITLLLESFFDACDARVEEVARKRNHVASAKHSPGKQQGWGVFFLFFSSFSFFLFFFFALLRALSGHPATLCL